LIIVVAVGVGVFVVVILDMGMPPNDKQQTFDYDTKSI